MKKINTKVTTPKSPKMPKPAAGKPMMPKAPGKGKVAPKMFNKGGKVKGYC